ncbi:DNA glycosylase AlkZ-like family protein [Ornithinimicrobium sp. LYQ103]|uniref:DNA glycosylase AlkZ-like family protein n=1 Tax=Ornithinimicrobium sp. LYQ103 TaxID=3378796 RepID=UPI003851AC55
MVRSGAAERPVEPDDVGGSGVEARIKGVRGRWRVYTAYLDQTWSGRTALLSPLDRLVFDRRRMVDLLEFDYQLEMYKPASRRRWGHYALPVLHGDRLVGKVDATADHPAGVLRVPPSTRTNRSATPAAPLSSGRCAAWPRCWGWRPAETTPISHIM